MDKMTNPKGASLYGSGTILIYNYQASLDNRHISAGLFCLSVGIKKVYYHWHQGPVL
jgi:hypothetical protein